MYNPFVVAKLNKLEQTSILTAATTIYCGLYYLSEDLGEAMKIFLFVLILISNAAFFIPWLCGLLEAYAIILVQK